MIKYIKKLINKSKPLGKVNAKVLCEASYDKEKEVMTFIFSDGSEEQYNGSSTVWRRMPLMRRCNTLKEGELCDIWNYINFYGNPYPKAHKK